MENNKEGSKFISVKDIKSGNKIPQPLKIDYENKTQKELLNQEMGMLYRQMELENSYYEKKLQDMKDRQKRAFQNSLMPQKPDEKNNLPIDGDYIQGSKVYMASCSGCHSLDGDSQRLHNTGPALGMIFGRPAGSDVHYRGYSDQLLNVRINWTSKNLFNFIRSPQDSIPGIKCQIKNGGIENEELRSDLIRFFKVFQKNYMKNLKYRVVKNFGRDYVNSQMMTKYNLQQVGDARLNQTQNKN